MDENKGLHLLYKKLGETPLECILRFKKENPEYADVPMTYAGRLDPMAEGLLLALSGESVKDKEKYLGLDKTYEFEILWGFQTDTLDVLGILEDSYSTYPSKDTDIFLLENSSSSLRRASLVPSQDMIETNLLKSVGKFIQKYPAYSSKPVGGTPLFQLAREGKLDGVKIPEHEVEVFEPKFLERRSIFRADFLKEISSKIDSVQGDFRQSEILAKWRGELADREAEEFAVDRISLTVSSGFYVRQFVADMAENFGTKALTFHIKRTGVGEYKI